LRHRFKHKRSAKELLENRLKPHHLKVLAGDVPSTELKQLLISSVKIQETAVVLLDFSKPLIAEELETRLKQSGAGAGFE
jgi:hypothetical protein